ncbi:MAG: 6-phosphogluconolactonase [Phenylobacterium sp.]|uniref:6-phosphogluconolactonase n=1 Tax=Phenylobacterium sp. TaxID=1871053 RepID=UPI002717EEB1|nr:6-phosphogluconolactonase [Phenylobacterium sp.]MDO8410353.1 6-phosphogluconolactonase [Phenylobacterium sp.]
MIERFDTPETLADAAAEATVLALAGGIAARGRGRLVVTGGRSPGAVYDRLAKAELDWGLVDVTLSDERFVAVTDAASNERLVRSRLLTGKTAAARFVPLMREAPSAAAAADLAEAEVAALAPFDMTLLGMGPDGHVASLIPGAAGLEAAMAPGGGRFCRGFDQAIGDPPRPRITLTLAALLQSQAIIILIAGPEKHGVVERAQAGADLPVRALLTQSTVPVRVLWTP